MYYVRNWLEGKRGDYTGITFPSFDKESLSVQHTKGKNIEVKYMKKSRLDLPHIKLLIAHGVANGRTQREIAQELGTSQPAISRIIRHADVLALIRKEENRLFLHVKKELQRIKNDPKFLAEFQRALEKELLNFNGWF